MPTGTWAATVVDRTKEINAGVDRALTVGTLVTVEAPSTGSVPIKVQLDYGKFENLYGADWSSRLRLVQFPECYLTTPLEEACQAYTELETVNDAGTDSITATVDTAADGTTAPASFTGRTSYSGPAIMQASYTTATPTATGGDKAVVGAVDSGAGSGGSFKATPLASSGKWSAGGSSGAFTWSYPLVVPPAPAGSAPNVSFNYSSQTVDGKTSVSSPQASWIGEGWDYDPGHIERRYRTCKDDTKTLTAGVPNNTVKANKTSDLCWVSYNAVMSLGGKTTELVRDDTATTNAETDTETYRPQSDDGTRIQRRTGGTNGDNNGEYWVVTTTDGTEYYFGQNKVDGGHANTNSVSTVPVFGNHPKEPCYQDTFSSSRCGTSKQAWRWGLDKVVDVHGNVMVINWAQEKNHYAVREKRKTPEQYDRFAYPTSIEYGMRAGALTDPAAKVVFGVQQRCLKSAADCASANFDKTGDAGAYRAWWDTPGALNCKSNSSLCPSFPSFWTQMRLGSVTTWAARAGQTGLGKVDTYNLYQSFPEDWYDSSPGLWLNSITRTGFGPGDTTGTLQSKDGVSFAKYTVGTTSPLRGRLKDQQLRNLVPTGSGDKRPPFTRPRIGTVATEAGGSIEVEYTGGCGAEPAEDKGKSNTYCYPVRWSPDGDEKTPAKAWFNKYVVDSVTETDKVTSPFSKPIYTKYRYYGPAWAKSNDEFTRPALRTYSDWRGYGRVTVTKGSSITPTWETPQSQSFSEARYFQGVGGEIKDSTGKVLPVADEPQYAGMTAETITYLNSDKLASGTPKLVSRTLNTPESTQTASRSREADDGSDPGPLVAHRTSIKQTDTIKTVGTSWQAVRSATLARDSYGLPTKVETAVVEPNGTGGENLSNQSCTKTTYIHNTSAWLIGLPKSKRTTATPCTNADTAVPATELKGSVEITYDNGAGLTKGLATSTSEIDGTGTSHSVTTTTAYDPLGRIRTVTAPDSGMTETVYTPGDEGGPVTTVKTSKTVNSKVHETTTTYDPGRALPLTVTDPNKRVTRNQYDALGRLDKGWSASRSSGSQTPNVDIDYQPAIATATETRPAAVTVKSLKDDGTYATQVAVYDGLLRQIQTQSEAVGPGRIISDTKYNDQGLPEERTSGYLAKGEPETKAFEVKSATLIPSRVKTYYDGLARPTRQTTFHGANAKHSSYTGYGDNSVTVDPPGSTVPKTMTISDALGRVTEMRHYTALGSSGPYRSTMYSYDKRGNRTAVTDPAGNAWTYTYDARGRVTSATDPDTGTTTTQYDAADRPSVVTDALGQSIHTTYDVLGRTTAVREGSATATPVKEFKYDKDGALGLLEESKRHTTSGDYVNRITGYDIEYRPTGRETVVPSNAMTTGLSGTYAYSYTYTLTGKPLSTTLPAKGGLASEKVITRYNEDGLPEATSGRDWYTTDATYSPYGEVLRTVSSAQPYRVWTTNFINNHTGQLQRSVTDRETEGPHRVTDIRYAYDTSGMITASARENDSASGKTWDNQCFTYDAMGELVNAWTSSIAPPALTQTETGGKGCKAASGAAWGHRPDGTPSSGPVADAPHQAGTTPPANLAGTAPDSTTVATGTTAYRQSFTFDWLGNRATMTDHDPAGDTTKNTGYTYKYSANQPHTLLSADSTPTGKSSSYTYNATGTTKTRDLPGTIPTQTLQWTNEQKLESNTAGGVKTTYVYDAEGNRILENSPTGSTLYLGETELTTNGTTITRASRSYSQAGAPTVVRTTNGTSTGHGLTALIADHLGTANTAVELSGTGTQAQAVTRRHFKPYGELRGPKPTTWPNKRGYLGVGIDDTATGLTHIGAREYDQNTGRFISADPLIDIADPLQMNGYTYANGNPVSKSDPTGLRPDGICGGNSNTCRPDNQGNEMSVTYHETWQPTRNGWKFTAYEERNGKRWHDQYGGVNFGTVIDLKPRGLVLNKNTIAGVGRSFSYYLSATPPFMLPVLSPTAVYDSVMEKIGIDTKDPGYEDGEMLADAAGLAFAGIGVAKAGAKAAAKNPCHSFLPGTEVLMADGSRKKIEEVTAGDTVVTTDVETGKNTKKKVLETIRTEDDKDFTEITLATGETLSSIIATDTHPFWVPALKEWIPAGNLKTGQWLRTSAGTLVQITKLDHYTKRQRTHDLTIGDIHAYYVLAGATPVLVHNCGGSTAGHSPTCACATGAQPRLASGKMGPSLNPRPKPAPSTHGNSRNSSAKNYLYVLEDANGGYLKTGITQDPAGRYSAREMAAMGADRMRVLTSGSRSDMLDLEKWIVQRWPGPFNKESHAGKMNLGL
ncbi:polymorphic toxin-type HINT domain-containing protein [Streptomyces sp. NPDC096068]|uniref:polymorphic toxin-type HINT domain-containing protein n=1 Tax=Streptomyces sp. NPDC096068 TaxID=3155424 RepID=UPI003325FE50